MAAFGEDAARFREAMSRVPMAVHVVTTDGPAGRHGATATAVASVTDAPPTLLVCLNLASAIAARVARNGVLAVSVLAANHEALARAFARASGGREDDRFSHGTWHALATGAPTLADAVAAFDGRVTSRLDVGSHAVMFVTIEAMRTCEQAGEGLLYHRRDYGSHDPAEG